MRGAGCSSDDKLSSFYNSWAKIQLGGDYDLRRSILLKKADHLADLVPSDINFATAVEIGCAEGIVINRLCGLLNIQSCYGIDIATPFLTFAKKLYPEIKFIKGSSLELPFPDKSIDLIVLSDIIEHMKDLALFMNEVKRVGKWILLRVPLDNYLWRKLISEPLERSPSVGPGHPDGHIHEFSKKSCIRMLKGKGFKIFASRVTYQYQYIKRPRYHEKAGILKLRWIVDYKLKQFFPSFAHKIFGGKLSVFASIDDNQNKERK
jgi:predicted SAM-dependent methyltransferase